MSQVAHRSLAAAPAGFAVDEREIEAFTLVSSGGVELDVMTYGGIVLALRVPDRHGRPADVALGYRTPVEYLDNPAYFGAIVGRYANRIGGAHCVIDGRLVALDANDGPNHLHGGHRGLDRVVWAARPFERAGARGVVLTHESPDGVGGYPGTLRARVTYTLTDRNEWVVDYHATTTEPTPLNLTQHTYLNLAGGGSALGHVLTSPAARYVATDAEGIPAPGPPRSVDGTPFDFSTGRALGERIDDGHVQTVRAGGYDHTLAVPASAEALRLAARLEDPVSGRAVTVRTTEPGFQLYTANHVGGIAGKRGRPYAAHDGVAIETQRFPDSPNRPDFPGAVLRPGETFASRTVYAFSTS